MTTYGLKQDCRPAAGSHSRLGRHATAAGHLARSRQCAFAAHAQPNWSDQYRVLAAADQLDESERRLRLKAKQMAKKGPLSTGQSASLAAQKLQIDAQDALAAALQQMQTATEREQYEEAARLRDESLAWLEGWHKPVSPDSSRVSSLLYVRKEHSRWTGRWFTPGDFMHYDMLRSTTAGSSPELHMSGLLQDPRYGTPLFEVFILPAESSATAASGLLKSNVVALQSSLEEDLHKCSSFRSLTVALQSAQRAMNEILQVVPVRRTNSSSSSGEQPAVRITNQRIMILVDETSGIVTAAAVHSGNDSTLLTWRLQLHNTSGTSGSDAADATVEQPQSAVLSAELQVQSQAAGQVGQAGISAPFRPAESGNGAFKVTFTLDWHELDLLRGPGSIQRTGANSFKFTRHPLPSDIPISMCSTSNSQASNSRSTSWRLFRVDLQYASPLAYDATQHQARLESTSTGADTDAGDTFGGDCSPVSRSSWAKQIATDLQQLLSYNSSSISEADSSTEQIAALLAAAAAGTAPPEAHVSEQQQAVRLTEVALRGQTPAQAAAQPVAEDIVLSFEKLSGESVDVSFGGWVVAAHL